MLVSFLISAETKEVKEESAILVNSLRMFHEQPLYVFCDRETEYFLSCIDLNLEDIFFRTEMEEETLDAVKEQYDFEKKNE